ncbi:MAG: HD domain-containing protein [Lachnospiraceae bacterium]
MEKISQESIIKKEEIIRVISSTLCLVDSRLVEHGERVAYIALKICKQGGLFEELYKDQIYMLGLFHDVGAYKTEEITQMMNFETHDIWKHSIYGYLFLKNISPLNKYAESVLYHHVWYEKLLKIQPPNWKYAALLALADRIDMLIINGGVNVNFEEKLTAEVGRFYPKYVDLFLQANKQNQVALSLKNGKFRDITSRVRSQLNITIDDGIQYLKMLIHSIDFRSEYTVSHTISTNSISMEIAAYYGMSEIECKKIYWGSLLHDLGKMATPLSILESPGRLSKEEMDIMKTHVTFTEKIISGLVTDEVCKIAVRHHEKLDGSGYPYGLKEEELTLSEKIVAVADVVSALVGKRSYKREFSKETTLDIIKNMRDTGKLSREVCNVVIEQFDFIMKATHAKQIPVIEMYDQISKEYELLITKFTS